MPSDVLAERILRFVRGRDYEPKGVRELAQAMGIGSDEHGDFHDACKALMRSGRIVMGQGNAVTLPAPPGKLTGTFRANPRGFGFVVPDVPNAHGDLYIPVGSTGGALSGDTVTARVLKRGKRGSKMLYEGRVLAVHRRAQSRFVGELHQRFNRWFVVPDGNAIHVPIIVGDPGAKGARPGDQVVVEVLEYPSDHRDATGVIVKVLGVRGEADVDVRTIIEQYQLPLEFSESTLAEARDAARDYKARTACVGREDLRGLTVITIDPADARDFDDAISLTKNRDGSVELGVHIADVSHFVRQGSALDDEARQRSNSVYLPRTVIPMLPEVLSNGVCSLQERQPRLTKSVFITYTPRGKVKKTRFANSVIRSTKRLTYEQASGILAGKRGRINAKVMALLTDMERLAQRIRERRLREGMLELELPEGELVYEDDGRVLDVRPEDTSFSHKIIEMFMVEANEAVARRLSRSKVAFLRRIHDRPRNLDAGGLPRFLRILGYELRPHAGRNDLQKLLRQVRDRDEAFAVNLAVLRSLPQAEYAPLPLGHYALASDNYCHFTSPIRRYADLTVHRLLDLDLRGRLNKGLADGEVYDERELAKLGELCTTNEHRAEAAERELKLVLVLRLLEERYLGDTFEGTVTGVANIGVFVQLQRFLIEGLLRFNQLPDDWWELDSSHGCVVGQRTGRRITLGDRLKVVISRIHLPTRRMELTLLEPPVGGRAGTRRGRARKRTPKGDPRRLGRRKRRPTR